ncbi:hypothetical protein ACFXC8_55915 [Streptomyces sp. NPDC059441]|uniref:hypothetical protein n=1 Tax=Streptomyces sp. NPDC059441 TaxID=3346829 RepID=UPI003698EB34
MREIPEQTRLVARAAFPRGSLAMRVRDSLGAVFSDAEFAGLFARRGHPALSPAFLAMVSVLQYAEVLTDGVTGETLRSWVRQAVEHAGRDHGCGEQNVESGDEELARLPAENSRLRKAGKEWELEREILRRAAAHFAKEMK